MYRRYKRLTSPKNPTARRDEKHTLITESTSHTETFPMELLPLEILYLVIERVDPQSFINCLYVCKKWRSITLNVADTDKKNRIWRSIFESYHEEESFRLKSSKVLSYKAMFMNSISWNANLAFSLGGTCSMSSIVKINICRDYIIVIDNEGVKYFDSKMLEIIKQLLIYECADFIERDEFILRCTYAWKNQDKNLFNLLLYGKNTPDDNEFEIPVERILSYDYRLMNANSVIIEDVIHYAIEKNCCYIMNHKNVLTCYVWKDSKRWDLRILGRFYGNRDDIRAMNVLNSAVFVMIKNGQLMYYCYKGRNFQEASHVRMPANKTQLVKIVHKYCVVMEVPSDSEFRITRRRDNDGYNYYKLECPNLTCVTQHGEMLFLGFNDGKVELFMLKAQSREDMFKHRIHINDFVKNQLEPEDLIVKSIDVYEDFERHHIFIATCSCVYQIVVTHPDGVCIWNNIPDRSVYYKYPIRTRYL